MTIKTDMTRGAMTFPVPHPSEDPLVTAKMKRITAPIDRMRTIKCGLRKSEHTSQERDADYVKVSELIPL